MSKNLGTDQNILISNNLPENLKTLDSIAKLNIMTEAKEDFEENIPQIMFSQTTTGETKAWSGDRLVIKYSSGNNAGYFGISEITGGYRERLNFEILGSNNLFHTNVNTFANSLIFSQGNKLSDNDNNCNFIHSDYNTINSKNAYNINYVNSLHNTIKNGVNFDILASAKNISYYNSNYNTLYPYPTTYRINDDTLSGKLGCYINNQTFIGSNYNHIKGRTESIETNYKTKSTFINSNSSLYHFDENAGSLTVIGNTLGYYNNVKSGNIIEIGEGLIQDGGNADKIILGFYNKNSTDPNEILIVGDGRLNKTYVNNLVEGEKNWTNNYKTFKSVIKNISGDGSTAKDSDYYRHNIFTVNKEGYITIADYNNTNSARYGFDGITGYVNNEIYKIPFKDLYFKLNQEDAITIMQESIDSITVDYKNKIDNLPKCKYKNFEDPINITQNTQTTGYLNYDVIPNNNAAIKVIPYYKDYENNTIICITYQPQNNRTLNAILKWKYKKPGDDVITEESLTISPYSTKQFIFIKPSVENTTAFSGLSLIDN